MVLDYWFGAGLALLVAGYLVYALLRAERF